MIGQYLPNNNETATVAFRQKFCQLNSLLSISMAQRNRAYYLQYTSTRKGRQAQAQRP
jgi:hypothetical protein